MSDVILAIRLLLAAVFVVAGVGKLVDLDGSRRSLAGFGVPAFLRPAVSLLLPLLELALSTLARNLVLAVLQGLTRRCSPGDSTR
jgi:uncharacterized membrane protein YphA (DoxX/SURF4 family)